METISYQTAGGHQQIITLHNSLNVQIVVFIISVCVQIKQMRYSSVNKRVLEVLPGDFFKT